MLVRGIAFSIWENFCLASMALNRFSRPRLLLMWLEGGWVGVLFERNARPSLGLAGLCNYKLRIAHSATQYIILSVRSFVRSPLILVCLFLSLSCQHTSSQNKYLE